MTKIYLVNFATPDFYKSQERLNKSALHFGVDETIPYTFEMLKGTDFYKKNESLFQIKRGVGYFAWKPYIILEVLKKIEDEDILIYCDSGIEITDDLKPFIKRCQKSKGVVLFENKTILCKNWTKRDCFFYMGCDTKEYHDAKQVIGGFSIWRRTPLSLKILSEWLKFCEDRKVVSDDNNICGKPNFPDFVEHRWDQSILSLLAVKYKRDIDLALEEDYSRFNPKYGVPVSYLFTVHRSRERKPLDWIIWKIKLMTPVSLKDKIKWFIGRYVKK
jgi:hypothetical protein